LQYDHRKPSNQIKNEKRKVKKVVVRSLFIVNCSLLIFHFSLVIVNTVAKAKQMSNGDLGMTIRNEK